MIDDWKNKEKIPTSNVKISQKEYKIKQKTCNDPTKSENKSWRDKQKEYLLI
jgi:hypothetical protein